MKGSAFVGAVTHPNLPQLERGTERNGEKEATKKKGGDQVRKWDKDKETERSWDGERVLDEEG